MKCRTILNVAGTTSTVGAIACLAFGSAITLSCGQSSKTEGNSFNSEGSDAGGRGGTGGTDSTGTGSEAGGAAIIASSTPTDGASAPTEAGTPTCASSSYQGKVVPVDMFIMMDQSGSMSDTVTGPNGIKGAKWDFLKQAFAAFVEDPRSAGLGVGIQFFPIPNIDNSSCDAATYSVTNDPAEPASGQGVPIAPLPGNSSAIVASLGAHTPGGQTPTVAALTGAIEYATNWIAENPTHKVVVVYATDGDPHGCTGNTIQAAASMAAAASTGTPPIPTYVIGIGDSLSALNEIADAGATGTAVIVSTQQDTTAQFLAALNQIRSVASVPCILTIPVGSGGAVDFAKVNVVDTPSDGGAPTDFYQVTDANACPSQSGGWFYDNASAPTNIHLCPATCNAVTQSQTDQIDILLGCQTMTSPPPR